MPNLKINITKANQPSQQAIQEFTDKLYQLMLKAETETEPDEDN
jgi:hypothetical protein